ncbi:P-loop containing nucleoside triphosphate hydrolase protein [Radiomyces spectabilis]|uniref:P-loop containing nucleoside triphosphate hydrolase protein n=1 Tax=Radiomyces spectabilis TaxID=64574 RepID=UPI00221FA526|nr:P-loop containing nucleoside triphosphate hydrolase protein [Radiomyces spectabilis]KAI8384604.1 P-loop containing nucleoside triphosphate hydrolase protein [Radiomyces spectabilis]
MRHSPQAIKDSIVPDHVWNELVFCTRTGLAPKGSLAAYNHSDHTLLHIPEKGTTFIQDKIAKRLAQQVEADLLSFDSQDFLFLAKDSYGKAMTLLPMMSPLANQNMTAVLAIRPGMSKSKSSRATTTAEKHASVMSEDDEALDADYGTEGPVYLSADDDSPSQQNTHDQELVTQLLKDQSGALPKVMEGVSTRYSSLFRQMLSKQINKEKDVSPTLRPKVVYLRDYGEMHDMFGSVMLKALVTAVEDLKQKGHPLTILAGYSPSLRSTDNEMHIDDVPLLTGMKCITVPLPLPHHESFKSWEVQLTKDGAERVAEMNVRQILAVYSHKHLLSMKPLDGVSGLDKELSQLEGIQDEVWAMEDVDRCVTTAVGSALQHKKSRPDLQDFAVANEIVQKGIKFRRDTAKLLERQPLRLDKDGTINIDALRSRCDDYEKKLLSRIVDPSKIQGSFKDVRTSSVTIETLQTLISLPLIRPDLFQHGILKRNFISGVLLFGPPGTGKTMLAKAVAKESGSRMLEIQASDIYEMYLGEGEKNVKALFSLARKLSPCVIFIDEVDSLMNRRRSDATSNSHREIINQFMVEWDGLTSDNQGVMVMAATNRPFDLDDAVLRRMPRRILVDLPKEEDRAHILQMLLRDEQHKVSVAELARVTEHYSGSDLKNLCVTAALRAVQQEVSTKKKRVLGQEHFDQALKLVPASSGEDMDSVIEIRKWAAKYGDGDKKKKPHLGFA